MKYNVHLWVPVRMKVVGVEAESQTAAIDEAMEMVDGAGGFGFYLDSIKAAAPVDHIEYTDDTPEFAVVDEENDPMCERSGRYRLNTSAGEPWLREGGF